MDSDDDHTSGRRQETSNWMHWEIPSRMRPRRKRQTPHNSVCDPRNCYFEFPDFAGSCNHLKLNVLSMYRIHILLSRSVFMEDTKLRILLPMTCTFSSMPFLTSSHRIFFNPCDHHDMPTTGSHGNQRDTLLLP